MFQEVKVEFEVDNGNGKIKKKSETYLVDALSVTEAEARVIEHFKSSVTPFEVKSVRVSKVVDIIKVEE